MEPVTRGPRRMPLDRSSSPSNIANRYRASCGPGPASGWYCTLNAGTPSIASLRWCWSLRLRWVTVDAAVEAAGSTQKLWFWLVISTLPLALVAHGMVAAVMAERQLECLAADCPAEQLMAETDAEHRHLAQQRGDRIDRITDLGRVAGPIRQEHAGGPPGQHVHCRVDAGTT